MRTKPCLTLDDVKKILAAAEAEAMKNRWSMAISVHDDGGHLIGLMKMDGASPGMVDTALAKGRTAALSRRSTHGWEERAKERMTMLSLNYTLLQGALPIMVLGECVGSVGVSGAASPEDEQVAQAGINALGA
jgi:glc operon protein GlcG